MAARGCRHVMEGHDVRVYVPESTGLNGMSENCETSHTVLKCSVLYIPPPSTVLVRALCLVGCVVCAFLAVSAKFLHPECQFSYMLYEIAYIYSLSVFRPA